MAFILNRIWRRHHPLLRDQGRGDGTAAFPAGHRSHEPPASTCWHPGAWAGAPSGPGPGGEPVAWPPGGEAVTSGLLLWVSPGTSCWVFLFLQREQTHDLSSLTAEATVSAGCCVLTRTGLSVQQAAVEHLLCAGPALGQAGPPSAYVARHLATRDGDGEVGEESGREQETGAAVLEEREDAQSWRGDSKGKWGGSSRQREPHVHSHHSVTVCGRVSALQSPSCRPDPMLTALFVLSPSILTNIPCDQDTVPIYPSDR